MVTNSYAPATSVAPVDMRLAAARAVQSHDIKTKSDVEVFAVIRPPRVLVQFVCLYSQSTRKRVWSKH